VQKGDRVVIYMPMIPEVYLNFFLSDETLLEADIVFIIFVFIGYHCAACMLSHWRNPCCCLWWICFKWVGSKNWSL